MPNPKRKYIEAVFEMLQSDGYENISIRKVASQIGCSAPALYKHFPDIDELVSIASIRILHDYVEDARTLSQVDLNPLELNLQLWECLAFYSFQNAPAIEHLFFRDGADGAVQDRFIKEYTSCFPEEFENLKDFMLDMFSTADIFERNAILLYRAADRGMLSEESAERLRDVDVYLFRGMLASLRHTYKDKDFTRQAIGHFMKMTISNYQAYLNPGFSILVVEPGLPVLNLDTQMNEPQAFQVISSSSQSGEIDNNPKNPQETELIKGEKSALTKAEIRQRIAKSQNRDFIHPLFDAGSSPTGEHFRKPVERIKVG